MALAPHGRNADEVIAELHAKRARDVDWAAGRTFGLVYDGGPGVHEVAQRAALLYLHDNALNTMAFPSLGEIQREIVAWTAALLHGGDTAAGFVTSGGTESIQCAVLAARERARHERSITEPAIVLATSAHAAFHKAAHMYQMPVHQVPVGPDWRVDLDAMAAAIDANTALVVASAPQYPQGVIDQVPEIAALAASVGAHCHVDACMGGFVLPFAELLGRPVPPWDFRVDGVDSISADVHKLGYAPKGASVVLYRTKELRRYQTFAFSDWLGGFYASPNLQGTRSGSPMAAAWAVMAYLGVDGYVALTRTALDTADRLRAGIAALPAVRTLGDGDLHLVAMAASDDGAGSAALDIFALGDALMARGWYTDRQGPPEALHHTVSNGNAAVIEEYLDDVATAIAAVGTARVEDRSTRYATLE